MFGGIVPHFTPPAHVGNPHWRCCDVTGAEGETECWVCGGNGRPAPPPSLHTSTGVVIVGYPADLEPVDTLLTERTSP